MKIEHLTEEHVGAITRTDGGNGWKNAPEAWAEKVWEHGQGKSTVLVAVSAGEVCGYGSLIWQSAYPSFAESSIPEISDLVTARAHRGRGIAKMVIAEFETIAASRGYRSIGLGIGLYADYGPAQRLYMSLGYTPDGQGVTYDCQPVEPGSSVRLDDDLVLWMSKSLPTDVALP